MGRILKNLYLVLLTLSLQSCLATSASASDIIVRCGLVSLGKPTTITLSCTKPFDVMDKDSAVLTTIDQGDVTVKADNAGIMLSSDTETIGQYPAPVRCVSSDPTAIFKVTVTSPKTIAKLYRGILEIGMKPGLFLVNELPLEDYVRGVIPAEVGKGMQPEAQKAQVVAIRTYALTSLDRHKADGYNVCDTTNCQGFSGATRDAAWVDAVQEATRGQVITYGGKLIHAVYSTDCGGMTRNNEDAGFGDTPWPYLRAVTDAPNIQHPTSNFQLPKCDTECPEGDEGLALGARAAATPGKSEIRNPKSEIGDPKPSSAEASADKPGTRNPKPSFAEASADYCAASPGHSWTKTYTLDDLDRIFAPGYSSKIGKLQSVEFVDYDTSGRPRSAVIKGDKGEVKLTSIQFRSRMGENLFKSMRMTLTVAEDGRYVFTGRGFGHGVGLCAYGSDGLAETGMKYEDILKFYYTGVEITSISDVGLRIAD